MKKENLLTWKHFSGILLLCAIFLMSVGTSQAKTTTIRVGNWIPYHHAVVQGILIPWAKAIETDSGGTLKVSIMKTPLGRPNTYYDMVASGALDSAFGVCGHNTGRFLMTQVMETPFTTPDAYAGAAGAWLTFKKYGAQYDEHKGVKIIGLWTTPPCYLNMVGDPIIKISDLAGKKIRVGGGQVGNMVKALGGIPVQLPPTEAQQAMSRGVVDGITFPLEAIDFFKITDAIKSATLVPFGLFNETFWMGFNETKWEKLTDKQREVIEKNSGLAMAKLAGSAWTNSQKRGRKAMEDSGVAFNIMSDDEVAKAKTMLKPMVDAWIREANKRGLNGDEILTYARKVANDHKID